MSRSWHPTASSETGERPFLFYGDCPVVLCGGASLEQPQKEKTLGRELTRRAVVRDGRSPPRFRRPYSPHGDFGKISSFQGIAASLDSAGRRSLTAAQAANDFTRNCVLGFTGNWYFQIGSAIRGCAECFYGTLRTSIRISYSGLPVPLVRYGERYAFSSWVQCGGRRRVVVNRKAKEE